MSCCRNHQNDSDQQDHIRPLDAIFGGHDTCPLVLIPSRSRGCSGFAFRAAGQSAPLHKETNCQGDYREYHCDLNYIRQRQVLHLAGLFRQFDAVRVFLISLVLFSKDLFQPLCLLFCHPFIGRRGRMTYKEVLTQTSHRRVPTSWRPAVFSRLVFFIAIAFICALPWVALWLSFAVTPQQRSAAHSHSGSWFLFCRVIADSGARQQAEDCRQVAEAMIPKMELSQKATICRPLA